MILILFAAIFMAFFTLAEHFAIRLGNRLILTTTAKILVYLPVLLFLGFVLGPEMSEMKKLVKLVVVLSIGLLGAAASVIAVNISYIQRNARWWNKPLLVVNMITGTLFFYTSIGYALFYSGAID